MSTEVELKAIGLVEKFYFQYKSTGRPFEQVLRAGKHKKSLGFLHAKSAALIAVNFAIEAIGDCSVVAGHPLEEYEQIKEELLKL